MLLEMLRSGNLPLASLSALEPGHEESGGGVKI